MMVIGRFLRVTLSVFSRCPLFGTLPYQPMIFVPRPAWEQSTCDEALPSDLQKAGANETQTRAGANDFNPTTSSADND